MKRKITPSTFIILMFILIGTASQVKAQCPAITINSFSVSTDTICPNGTVSFNVWTTYSNTIAWDLGNGKVSTSRDVSTKYTTPGKYYITCLVSSTCGNDTLLTDSIVVNANIPRFSLNANPSNADSVCPNERAFFNINGDFKSIMWSFDNGHKSDKSYVMEKFATMGDHTYTLILTDHCDNDTTIYGKTVVRITSEFIDDVNISISDSTCKTANLSYYNNGDLQDVRWYFGDGDSLVGLQYAIIHNYNAEGKYPVTLVATDFCSNKQIVTDTIVVNSKASPLFSGLQKMTDTICPGDEFYTIIQAERADEFQWDMKDGNKLQGSIIFHKYTTPGMHYFSVKISNSCGNELTVTDSIYVSNSYKTNLNSYAFDLLTNEACMGDNFTLLSFPYTNATFGLGDGNKANEKADTLINYMGMGDLEIGLTNFSYNALGSYTIIAMTENGCGFKDTLEVGTVEVVPSTKASAIISIDFYSESPYAIAYLNKPTSFYVGLTSNYFIDYGDGSTKTFSGGSYAIDKHIYKAEGTYTVSLIASNSCGESDSTGMIIKVIRDPKGYLSVKESTDETMSIEAFPNPTNDNVTFKFDRNANENMLFSIYNLQGQLMHQQYISNANKVDFDFSAFSSGMYITSFVSETQNSSKRITLVK